MKPSTRADLELERLPQDYAAGTSKLYSLVATAREQIATLELDPDEAEAPLAAVQ